MLLLVIVIALVGYALQLFLPWWIIAVVCFIASAVKAEDVKEAFTGSFVGIALLWGILTALNKMAADNVVAHKIGEIFHLSFALTVVITALVGGIAAGIAGTAGFLIKDSANIDSNSNAF